MHSIKLNNAKNVDDYKPSSSFLAFDCMRVLFWHMPHWKSVFSDLHSSVSKATIQLTLHDQNQFFCFWK